MQLSAERGEGFPWSREGVVLSGPRLIVACLLISFFRFQSRLAGGHPAACPGLASAAKALAGDWDPDRADCRRRGLAMRRNKAKNSNDFTDELDAPLLAGVEATGDVSDVVFGRDKGFSSRKKREEMVEMKEMKSFSAHASIGYVVPQRRGGQLTPPKIPRLGITFCE